MPNYAVAPAPETNTLAIISLVASILSWVLVPIVGGIVGVVTGFMARNQIRESNGQQTGDGLALTGIIVGAINLVVGCIGVLCFTVIIIGGVLSNSGR
jgi:heme/copper-type cytochrome/quinol oxidase subunit 2